MRTKLLFVCSRNQWRSPTAEALFASSQTYDARSAGTSPQARVRVSEGHLRWADRIFVMERRHRDQLIERFGRGGRLPPVTVLDIPDDFQFMDPDLIELLKQRLSAELDLHWN
jgi:predicted protein tyrosine phosphatase